MKRTWLTVVMIAAVAGIVCSSISLSNFLEIQKSGVLQKSFCSISSQINCDLVEASSYSSIKGIPVSGLGLLYYIMILLFAGYARFSKGFVRPTVAFVWWTSLASIFYTFYMAYISTIILEVICPTCVGMYLSNIAIFLGLFLAMNMPYSDFKNFVWGYWVTTITGKKIGIDFMPRITSHILAIVIIFGIGMVFVTSAASNIKKPTEAELEEITDAFYKQTKYDLRFDKQSTPMWGTKGAPVTIVEFSDFLCPFCRLCAFTVRPAMTEYKKYVQYYFINYPLDSTCNHYMTHQMHQGSCLAAKAGICADRFGKFWEYHDELFRATARIDEKMVKNVAKTVGIDENNFSDCLENSEVERKLMDDIETARKIYLTGTPSIILNDRHLRFWRSPELLRKIIKKEIKESKDNAKN